MILELLNILFFPLLIQVIIGIVVTLITSSLKKKRGWNTKIVATTIIITLLLIIIITISYSFYAIRSVPKIEGISREDAEKMLSNSSLRLNVNNEIYSEVNKNVIIKQTPIAGKLTKKNTAVSVDVSKGLPKTPNLIGMNIEIAKELITSDQEAKFQFKLERGFDHNSVDSTVIEQYPTPGELVQIGSTVKIVYNSLYEIIQLSPYNKEGQPILPDAHGTIKIKRISKEGFVAQIIIKNMEAKHSYTPAINGNLQEDKEGNELLFKTSKCSTNDGEGYQDFTDIFTKMDRKGEMKISYRLPVHEYTLKFFVKDISKEYKPVLYNDIVRFKIIK